MKMYFGRYAITDDFGTRWRISGFADSEQEARERRDSAMLSDMKFPNTHISRTQVLAFDVDVVEDGNVLPDLRIAYKK